MDRSDSSANHFHGRNADPSDPTGKTATSYPTSRFWQGDFLQCDGRRMPKKRGCVSGPGGATERLAGRRGRWCDRLLPFQTQPLAVRPDADKVQKREVDTIFGTRRHAVLVNMSGRNEPF